jgi:pyruvate formate lyase activating enzyme
VPGRFWHAADDGADAQGSQGLKIVCDLCPRACRVGDGQRAFCFVRENRGGQMVLTTYGRASGFCLDPIEKKPLNHFYPGTSVLSFGTAGCNLGCRFCQNWDISKAREFDRLTETASPQDVAQAAVRTQARSVAFTYNDPVIFAEYAIDCAHACREQGIKTVAVTAGYIGESARHEFFSVMDAANVDLKGFSEHFYHKLCFAHLQPVLDTLVFLYRETDVWFEVTTLLIPGENDSEDEIEKLCDWFVTHLSPEVPLHFTAFHPDFKMLDREGTPASTLKRARRQALAAGMKHVYTGNVHDPAGQATYCAQCGHLLIERDWYRLGAFRIEEGRCTQCGHAVRGHFDAQPGRFGARRLPIHLAT